MHIVSRRHLAGDCRPCRPDNRFTMNVEAAVWLMRAWGGLGELLMYNKDNTHNTDRLSSFFQICLERMT